MDLPLHSTGRLWLCPALRHRHDLHFPFLFTRLRTERSQSPPWKTRGPSVGVWGGAVTGQGGILLITKLLPGPSNPFPSSWNLGRLSAFFLAPLFLPLAAWSFLRVFSLSFL